MPKKKFGQNWFKRFDNYMNTDNKTIFIEKINIFKRTICNGYFFIKAKRLRCTLLEQQQIKE